MWQGRQSNWHLQLEFAIKPATKQVSVGYKGHEQADFGVAACCAAFSPLFKRP